MVVITFSKNDEKILLNYKVCTYTLIHFLYNTSDRLVVSKFGPDQIFCTYYIYNKFETKCN